jgi:hypothetical protein
MADFVNHWTLAVELTLAGSDSPETRRLARQQSEALLAVNPLLLTVVALVQPYRAQLPERRTELYEEAIEVLLGQWDETKCNTRELGLGDTTPVGIFPEGARPYDCLDMAGNIWEWWLPSLKPLASESLTLCAW